MHLHRFLPVRQAPIGNGVIFLVLGHLDQSLVEVGRDAVERRLIAAYDRDRLPLPLPEVLPPM